MILDSGTLPLWFLSCGDEGLTRLVISMVISIFQGLTLLKSISCSKVTCRRQDDLSRVSDSMQAFQKSGEKIFRGLEARNKSVHNVSGSARRVL